MNHLVGTWLGASLVLVLAVHIGAAQNQLDPDGANVCSKASIQNSLNQTLEINFNYKPPRSVRQTDYFCCPGWIRTGRDCTIRDPCPEGIENCTDFKNNLVPKPTVTYRKGSVPKLEMVCSFDFPVWTNVSYLVEWYGRSITPLKRDTWCIPGQPIDDQNDCKRRESSIFLADHFALGDTVWCRLLMKFSTKKTNKWTKVTRESNKYYVGIEVFPRQVTVKECNVGENITVTLRPTIPILPSGNRPGTDKVVVSVLIPQKYRTQRRQVAVDKCKVELKTEDIKRGKNITIRGICDNQQDLRQTYCFNFKPETTSPSWPGLAAYRVPRVTTTKSYFHEDDTWYEMRKHYVITENVYYSWEVAVDNTETKLCYSTSDPHLYTFDNGYLFYNDLGDYMMYKNDAKKIQVHVRLWNCARDVSCICGAAIREGKDLLVISICNELKNSAPTVLKTVKRSPGSLSRGIEVTKKLNGASLDQEVTLSSGTRIVVHRSMRSLDVRVNAPATDKGRVSGLCGNFNGDPDDDFSQGGDGRVPKHKNDFAKSWRLTRDKSFFEVLPKQEKDEKPDIEERSCYCGIEGETKQEHCDYNANIFARIDSDKIEVITTQVNDQSKFGLKRSVDSQWYSDDIIDHVDRSYFVDNPHVQHALHRIRGKRSPRVVMSKDEATKFCRKHIEESEAGRTCKGISDTSINNAMTQCVKDLQFTGDRTFAVLAFESMKYVCEDTTLKNLSAYTHTPSGDLIPPKEEVKDLCPADCSGHGRCMKRTCICDKGFTALDCSMEVQAVPELLGIYNGGMCDVRERPCKKTSLLGQKFIDSKNLTCHVKEVKLFPSSWSLRGIPVKSEGKMTDIFGVKCNLPDPPTKLGDYDHEGTPAGGLLISVSNDGFRTSAQQLRQVTYDSKCLACSNSGKCQRKANSCLIRGHCFAANEPNPRDWCQQCLPRDNQDSWTRRKNNQVPKFSSKPIYRALRGEDLVIQLRATDPDNRPVKYSVLSSTATGYTFSPTGLLRGKVTSNEKFTFNVTDECGAFDTIDIRVRIVQCPCMNGGRCVPHPEHPRGSGLYQCQCVNGASGDRCEKTSVKPGGKVPEVAPFIRRISPVKYDTIWLTWSPIPQYKRNGIIRGYKVYYREQYTRQPWNVLTTPTGDMTSTEVTGLRPYSDYCVKMSAFTSDGEYPDWARQPCKRVKTPSLPIKVSGRAMSRTEILLKVQKPRRSPPSNRIQVDYGKQKNRLNRKKACYGSSCVIDNLDEDTMYYFRVIGYIYQRGETPSFTKIRTLPRRRS